MNLRPLHDRILVRRLEEKESLRGGIIIPDTAKEKPQQAEVVAVGNGKLLDDDESEEATPFQRAFAQSISHNPFGKNADFKLDPEGLHESNPEYHSVAFEKLSVEEARAYIEKYNREHGDLVNPVYLPTCLLVWLGFSLAAPFWPMVFEAVGIISVLFPGLFLFCFGPMIWAVMRSLGFIGWVTSLFHDI